MADAAKPADDEASLPPIVVLDDFRDVDLAAPTEGLDRCDAHSLHHAYGAAFRAADSDGRAKAAKVYRLLSNLLDIHLNPRDRGSVWGPSMSGPRGRTSIPTDFQGEQSSILAELAPSVAHPGVRARLADLAWSNNRRLGTTAAVAVQAYRECIEGLLDGRFRSWHGDDVPGVSEALLPLYRLLQVLEASTKRAKRPDWIRPLLLSVREAARTAALYPAYSEVVELGLRYELLTADEVVDEAEAFAAAAPAETYPEAVKVVWVLAGRLRAKLGDREGETRCKLGAFERTLAMREGCRGNAAAEASWISDALIELRHIPGMQDREIALEIELRRLQKESLSQMGSIPIEFDTAADRDAVIKAFTDLTLAESLRQFALLERSPDPEALRAEAKESIEATPLMAMMGVSHVDGDGRTVVKSPGAPVDDEPEEGWFDHTIGRSEGLRRHYVVAALIEPARVLINARFGVEERDLAQMVRISPIVPEGQKPLVVLGLTRLFQGDLMSAAHLVIPQLEPIVRQVLKIAGHYPSKLRDDGTEEDFALSGLFDRFADELAKVLGRPLSEELERLFNRRPGPALRHEFAHGQISAGACFHPDVYYAVWLVFRLCYLSVQRAWDDVVAQGLATTA